MIHITQHVTERPADWPQGEVDKQLTTICGLTVPLTYINGGPKRHDNNTLDVKGGAGVKGRCLECQAGWEEQRATPNAH